MRTSFKLSLIALAAVCAGGARAELLDTTAFSHRCTVTISGYAGASTLAGFPALVRIPANSPIYGDSVDGANVRFADADGNLVPCEVDTWNPNGQSAVWVRVPELTSAGATLTLYCGGTPAQDARAREVWADADYLGVWHFSGNANDSSTNNLAVRTSSTPPDFTQRGPVGTSSFHATNGRYAYVPAPSLLNDFDGTNFTVSGWVKATEVGFWRIVSMKNAYQEADGFEITMQNDKQKLMVGGPGDKQTVKDVNRNLLAEFAYFTAIYRDGGMTLYVDGVKIAEVASGYTVVPSEKNFGIGVPGGALGGACWHGWLDELRFQGRAQSEDWALADYATQVGSLDVGFGAFETLAGREVFETAAFGKSCTITFSGYTGATALENFPALVRIPASVAQYCAYNGGDIRFADADGYAIPHEIDTWNPQGESTVWVRVPRLEGTNTRVKMYFSGMPARTVNGRDVWDANYKGVWHFAGGKNDSSANDLTTYSNGSITYTSAGPVGTAYQSTSAYLYVSNDVRWAGFDNTGFAVSFWMKGDTATTMRMVSTKKVYSDENGLEITTQGNDPCAITVHGRSSSQLFCKTAPDYTADFIHVVTVYHDDSADIYANGVKVLTGSGSLYNVTGVTNALVIAGYPWTAAWKGQLDELRLQWAAPSADWVKADYDTQRAGSGFAVVGPLEDVGDAPVLETGSFRRKALVSFAGHAGAGLLVDFPALLRLPAGSPVYEMAAADGGDIRFTDLQGRLLPHEIDTWDANGESAIWVRVPELPAEGAQVYMYWCVPRGDVPAASTESVWARAGYRSVFHFSGTHADSTGNAVAVIEAGSPSFADVGKVGTAFAGASNSHLTIPNSRTWADYEGRDLTLSCWVKTDWASGNNGRCDRILSCKRVFSDSTGFELTTQNYSTRYNMIGSGNKQHTTPEDDTRADCATGFVYLTAVVRNRQAFVYANGELLKTGSAGGCPLATMREALRIGANLKGEDMWKGQIDEVRLRWGASSPDWVVADYAAQNDPAFSRLGDVIAINTGTTVILR